jgi:hypothetical protein
MSLDNRIEAVIILEILGRPKEHLTETLKKIVEEGIAKEPGITIKSSDIKEPKEIKEQKDFYTSFAELEIEFESLMHVLMVVFKYMPSFVQIITPEKLSLSNVDLNETLTELTRRLHGYEEVARVLQNERIILEQKLKEVLGKEGKKIDKSNDKPKEKKVKKK